MKITDFALHPDYFGNASTEGLTRFYVKDGYKAVLPATLGAFGENDPVDIIEREDFDDCVEFTSMSGNKHRVEVWESFELVVYEIKERIRFSKGA